MKILNLFSVTAFMCLILLNSSVNAQKCDSAGVITDDFMTLYFVGIQDSVKVDTTAGIAALKRLGDGMVDSVLGTTHTYASGYYGAVAFDNNYVYVGDDAEGPHILTKNDFTYQSTLGPYNPATMVSDGQFLYVEATTDNKLKKVQISNDSVHWSIQNASVWQQYNWMDIDQAGNLYVPFYGEDKYKKISNNGVVQWEHTDLNSSRAMAASWDGKYVYAVGNPDILYRLDPATGNVIDSNDVDLTNYGQIDVVDEGPYKGYVFVADRSSAWRFFDTTCTQVWSHPGTAPRGAYADANQLIGGDADSIIVFDLAGNRMASGAISNAVHDMRVDLEDNAIYAAPSSLQNHQRIAIRASKLSFSPDGYLASTNLLSNQSVYTIDSFGVEVASLLGGSMLLAQFSNDSGATWQNSAGANGDWDTLSAGMNTLNLSGLGWNTADFYYRMAFRSSTDSLESPELNKIDIHYTLYPPLTATTGADSALVGDNNGMAWVAPSGAKPPYTYLWSDMGGQTNDTAFSLTAGTYTVTVTDANNCSDTFQVTVPVDSADSSDSSTYVNDVSLVDGKLLYYPNPVNDHLEIEIRDLKGASKIKLQNTLGETVYTSKTIRTESAHIRIDLDALPAGIYLLHWERENGKSITRKISVVK